MLAILDGGSRVVGLKDGEPVAEGALRIWKHFGTHAGATAISLRVLELPAGERATLRTETSDEVLYVLSGSGSANDFALTPDACLYLPHGQVHCVENRGLGEMRLLGVFYPAGSPAVRYAAKG